MTFITLGGGTRIRLGANGKSRGSRAKEDRDGQLERDEAARGWTWKTWLGIALGVAVLVAVILIAANAGSGSGGIY